MKVKDYDVTYSDKQGRWVCSCPNFRFRKSQLRNGTCKHIDEILVNVSTPTDSRYMNRASAEPVANIIRLMMAGCKFEICGSYRRQRPTLKDLDVVTTCPAHTLRDLIQHVGYVLSGGDERITATINGLQVDFRICNHEKFWWPMVMHFTGSKEENIRLRKLAKSAGFKLNEYGLTQVGSGIEIPVLGEPQLYHMFGIPYKLPQERG